MKILVTGALGFIGAHFVERALAAGHEITGLYRTLSDDKRVLLGSLTRQGANLARRDILEVDASCMRDVDCVCHFAAAFKESGLREEDFQRINVTGTQTVLRAAADAGVRRFVLCSTAGIYGQRLAGITNESASPQPSNAYERSKHAAEQLVRTLAPQLGLEFVVLRPATVYGPRDDRLLKLFRSGARGHFPLFGKGTGRRHMVYVTDVADAFLRAATYPGARNQEMIIAGPSALPLREMLNTLASVMHRRSVGPTLPLAPMLLLAALVEDASKLIGVRPPIYRRRMDFYRTDVAFDCTRARQLLDWVPRVDLREGFRRTHEACVSTSMPAVAQLQRTP